MYFFAFLIFILFSVSVGLCSGSLPTSSLVLPLLSGTGFSEYLLASNTESCDEDDGEEGEGIVEEDSLVNQEPQMVQSWIFCHFWWDVVFDRLSSGSQSFPSERTASASSRSITVTNKSTSLTCTVASCLVCTSPLAVTVVGLLDVLMVFNSPELRSFLLTICTLSSWIYHKLSFLRLFCFRNREDPFFRGRVECSLVLFFELICVFGKVPCLASGASLSFSLFMGPVLKLRSVRTSLKRIFDIYFSQRWSFLLPDTRLTKRRFSEYYPLNWFQDFLDRVSRRLSTLRNECSWILWYTTQLWYTFHSSYSMLVVALSFLWQWSLFFGFLFSCSSTSWCGNKHLSPVLHPDSFFKRLGTRADANIHKTFARRSSSNNICTVVEQWNHGYFCLGRFSSSTHFDLVVRLAQKGVAAVCSGFCARSWVSWWKLHRLLANTGLFFPLVTDTFSSFNADESLSVLDHCSWLSAPVPSVKVS